MLTPPRRFCMYVLLVLLTPLPLIFTRFADSSFSPLIIFIFADEPQFLFDYRFSSSSDYFSAIRLHFISRYASSFLLFIAIDFRQRHVFGYY
jgi:hypothetical protein